VQTITLGGADYPLDTLTPVHQAHAYDLIPCLDARTTRRSAHRINAAAIVLACGKVRRKLAIGTMDDHGSDVLRYGGAAFAALLSGGATVEEIGDAGGASIRHLLSTLPPAPEEVEAAVGNSDATPEPSP